MHYLDTNRQVVLFDVLVVERMVHFDVGPRVAVVRSLLQVKRVVLVRLGRRAANEPVENGGVVLNAGAASTTTVSKCSETMCSSACCERRRLVRTRTHTRTLDEDADTLII